MISAKDIVRQLGGHWFGSNGTCRCPAHDDHNPSLSVSERDGVVLVHCFSGCDQRSVIAALRELNLWEKPTGFSTHGTQVFRPQNSPRTPPELPQNSPRTNRAKRIISGSVPIVGTLAETYLRSRAIETFGNGILYHPAVFHPMTARTFPAAVFVAHRGLACQCVYLLPDGSGKAAIEFAKITWGSLGGECVRLFPAGPALGLAEGPETALSAAQIFSMPVWATLGVERFGVVKIPWWVRELIIFSDAYDNKQAVKALKRGIEAQMKERSVRVCSPDAGFKDYNDQLRGIYVSRTVSATEKSTTTQNSIPF